MQDDIDLLKKEIKSLKDANVSLRVQKDQAVREASAKALDCEYHGVIIDDLERTLSYFDHKTIHSHQAYGILTCELARIQQRITSVKAPCDQIAGWVVEKIDEAMKSADKAMARSRAIAKSPPRQTQKEK